MKRIDENINENIPCLTSKNIQIYLNARFLKLI